MSLRYRTSVVACDNSVANTQNYSNLRSHHDALAQLLSVMNYHLAASTFNFAGAFNLFLHFPGTCKMKLRTCVME